MPIVPQPSHPASPANAPHTNPVKPETRFSYLEKAFIWLGGHEPATMGEESAAVINRVKALGMVTAVPAVLACLSISAFFSTQGFPFPVIVLGAIIWPLFVLAIDRALLATYSADDPPFARRMKLAV